MDQFSFFAEPAASPQAPFYQRDVVFFGIRLPELGAEAADVHRMLRRSHGLTGIPYQPGRLHVSLLRVGARDRLSADDIRQLQRAASAVSFRPFPISFEMIVSYDGNSRRDDKRPIVFPVADGAAEIIALARNIEAGLHHALPIEGEPPPSPHMTLLRDRIHIPPTALDPPFGARVTGFELICSHRRERRYETLWASAKLRFDDLAQ